jgi:hypothetical protein
MLQRSSPARRRDRQRERARRHRRRAAAGRCCASVELDGAALNFLIRLGWLNEREASDLHAIGEAIGAMLRHQRLILQEFSASAADSPYVCPCRSIH